ncbi:MAG: flagellin [Planctomycetota bacterium]|jgi:flagellin
MELGNVSAADLGPLIINEAYDDLSNSTEAIASGQKVQNQTALSIIAGQLRADVAVNMQGVRNANDAVSMVQTFDAAADSINSNLVQMARLAMQAGTGTFSGQQKAVIETEFNELAAEINRVAGNTQFNGNTLLGGEGAEIPVSLGTAPDISILSGDLSFDISGIDLTADSGSALAAIQESIGHTSDYRGYLGAQMNRLSEAVGVMQAGIEQAMATESGISDTDVAKEVAAHSASRIQTEMTIAVQSHKNIIHQTTVQLLM